MNSDTIASLATAPGEGAIAVIRISGPSAIAIGEKIFSKPLRDVKTHTARYGHILAQDGTSLDSVLLLVLRNPHSYTGEDSIEISCHGGSLVTRKVLERIYEEGARAAQPGEFSLRAYLNGKIDLAQAEAVQELIAAKSEHALVQAKKQLAGDLSGKIASFQKALTDIAAILEAWVDFPEEGLEFATTEEILGKLQEILDSMQKLQKTFHNGKILHQGLSLCLVGSPNVGKSSLMNALLGFDRAIVTDIAGTTRDLLEEDLRLGNFHFRLVDTAGIRNTAEIVEMEGIRRSQIASKEADLVLLLLDATRPLTEEDQRLLDQIPKEKRIIVWNKTDLAAPPTHLPGVSISALKKTGLGKLISSIEERIWENGPPSQEEVIITKERHYQALSQAISSLETVVSGLTSQVSAEFVTSDMRASLHALGTIIGTNVTEDILSAIFSKFCLGK